jgi:hypothetical protein
VDSRQTVASATAIVLPEGESNIIISGTADINYIYPNRTGQLREVTLVFSGTKATNGMVDGLNLKLASTLAYTPDDSITMRCDGTNWIEIARSVN